MARVKDTVFGPMLPKIDDELLPNKFAQIAENMRLGSGALVPLRLPAPVSGVTMPGTAEIGTIYRAGVGLSSNVDYWLQFEGDVDVVKGPIDLDTQERTYWTDGVYPKKSRADHAGLISGTAITPNSLRMGIPAPTPTPVATTTGIATDPDSTPITSTYVITYVTSWDEESAPSNASNIVTWRAGQEVSLTCPGALAGSYLVDRIRIYRSNTGTSRTTFQFCAELTVATALHYDSVLPAALGESCPTWDLVPPSDGMIGLTDMGNGMLAGFNENTVSFCEPNIPYAWPVKYDQTTSSPIVGIAHFGQTLVVGTMQGLTLITGTDPASMSQENPKGNHACISKRSMVSMLGGVIYASADGLIHVSASGVKNVTEDLVSVDEWLSINPASFNSFAIDGRYYAFYDNGTTQGLAILALGVDGGLVRSDQYATAAAVEGREDALYLVKRSGSVNTLNRWDSGAAMTASWKGKEHRFDSGVFMSRAKVMAASYPVTFKMFGDGALKYTKTVTDGIPFVLPEGRNFTVSYQVDTTVRVMSVAMATSAQELGDGNG